MHKGLTRVGIFCAALCIAFFGLMAIISGGDEAIKALVLGGILATTAFCFFAGLGWVVRGFGR